MLTLQLTQAEELSLTKILDAALKFGGINILNDTINFTKSLGAAQDAREKAKVTKEVPAEKNLNNNG